MPAAKAIKCKRSWMLRGHLTKYPKKCRDGAWSEKGSCLTATNTLMAELAQDWSRPEGSQLLSILFQEVLPPIA